MTCETVHRLVQGLSTSCCFVSNFETCRFPASSCAGTRHSPTVTIVTANSRKSAGPQGRLMGGVSLGIGLGNGPLPGSSSPLSQGATRAPGASGGLEAQAGPKSAQRTLGFFGRRPKKSWRSRPVSRVLSWATIPLGASSPIRSSNLPGPDAGNVMGSLFGLAPGGVCRAGLLPGSRCALTAPFHPCHASRGTVRRYLSVALSVGSRRPGVTWHRALWSPDFPRHPRRDDAIARPAPPAVIIPRCAPSAPLYPQERAWVARDRPCGIIRPYWTDRWRREPCAGRR